MIKYLIAGAGRDGRDLIAASRDTARHANLFEGRAVASAVFESYSRGSTRSRAEYQQTKWKPTTFKDREAVRYYLLDGRHFTFSAKAAREAYEQGREIVTTDATVTRGEGVIEVKNRWDRKKPEPKPANVYTEDLAW